MLPMEQEIARGMRFMHLMALAMGRQGSETARLIQELSRLLIAQNVFSDEEWTDALENRGSAPRDLAVRFHVGREEA